MRSIALVIGFALVGLSASARATEPVRPYVLAVGINGSGSATLGDLVYADDDAVAAAELFAAEPGRTWLHTVMDATTQRRAPAEASRARPPSKSALRASVAAIAERLQRDRAAGERPVVFVWWSGHAAYDDDGHAYFPLAAGGRLSAGELLEDVIAPLAIAHRVHVVLDTCFAGAMVRARAQTRSASPEQADRAFWRAGLGRFPNAGALVGASAGTVAYEWSEIGSGVFSAMVRAGLRGAADVDADGAVRYGELGAFLAAAAYEVPLDAAQPRFSVLPPAIEREAALLERAWMGDVSPLRQPLGGAGPVHIIDSRGRLLVAGSFEPGFAPTLWLPRGRAMVLRRGASDHPLVEADDGYRVAEAAPVDARSRSLVGEALRAGLFKMPFGPSFYRGYAASAPDEAALDEVALADDAPVGEAGGVSGPPIWVAGLSLGMGAAFAGATVAAGAFAAIATLQFAATDLERPARIHFTNAVASAAVAGCTALLGTALSAAGVALLFVDGDE